MPVVYMFEETKLDDTLLISGFTDVPQRAAFKKNGVNFKSEDLLCAAYTKKGSPMITYLDADETVYIELDPENLKKALLKIKDRPDVEINVKVPPRND
jgi:hypothetical protein